MGDDDYVVDKNGNIVLSKKTESKDDCLSGVNDKGIEMSINVSKGFLTPLTSKQLTAERTVLDENENEEKMLQTKQVEMYGGSLTDAKTTFEFMAQVTDVEWSLFKFGEDGDYPTGFLTTSHDQSTELGSGLISKDPLFLQSDFNGMDHIHPGGATSPSGYLSEADNPTGDVKLARTLITSFPDKELKFKIYIKTGEYIPYDDQTIEDEGGVDVIVPRKEKQ